MADKQKALVHELLKPKYQAHGFTTADIFSNLPEHFRNPAQIRYEMNKLRSRGALSKQKNKSFYRVTEIGWKCLPALLAQKALQAGFWLEICSTDYFKNPMISKTFKKGLPQIPEQPSKIDLPAMPLPNLLLIASTYYNKRPGRMNS